MSVVDWEVLDITDVMAHIPASFQHVKNAKWAFLLWSPQLRDCSRACVRPGCPLRKGGRCKVVDKATTASLNEVVGKLIVALLWQELV